MRKDHGLHNEEACDFLLESGKFNDWVVTTAFYSALHYVQYEIFPLTEGGTTYPTFNSYYFNVLKKKNKKLSKHKALIALTKKKFNKCSGYYRWLHDACQTARYTNYTVDGTIAIKARDNLNKIKSKLSK